MPWNRAHSTSRRKQHESVHAGGMTDRQLLGDRAAVGVSNDIRFLDAERSRTPAAISANMGIEYGTTGVWLAPTPGASNAITVLS